MICFGDSTRIFPVQRVGPGGSKERKMLLFCLPELPMNRQGY